MFEHEKNNSSYFVGMPWIWAKKKTRAKGQQLTVEIIKETCSGESGQLLQSQGGARGIGWLATPLFGVV